MYADTTAHILPSHIAQNGATHHKLEVVAFMLSLSLCKSMPASEVSVLCMHDHKK